MASEWLRIMLDEIERKREDARRAYEEEQHRLEERSAGEKTAEVAASKRTASEIS